MTKEQIADLIEEWSLCSPTQKEWIVESFVEKNGDDFSSERFHEVLADKFEIMQVVKQ
jgi:hypothetical protein